MTDPLDSIVSALRSERLRIIGALMTTPQAAQQDRLRMAIETLTGEPEPGGLFPGGTEQGTE